jgi:hypothetical protein
MDMSVDSHADRRNTRRPWIQYAPLDFSIDEAPPRVPALETLRGVPMNFEAIGVAAARLGRAASKDKDMRWGREGTRGHGKIGAEDGSTG